MPYFSEEVVQKVWSRADYVGPEPEKMGLRKDQCGAWIQQDKYEDTTSSYGWKIDHILPTSKGGTDSVFNLRPLQWQNAETATDGLLRCIITADNGKNIHR